MVGGLNLFRRYGARYGMPVTLQQALAEAGGREGLDKWTFDRMAELAPDAYLKPQEPAVQSADPQPSAGADEQLGLGKDVDD